MTYVEWLAHYDLLTPKDRADLEQEILKLDHRPLISILLPVYNGDLTFLNEAVASVQRQVYEHWEIRVADDASTNRQIRPFLENLSRSDRRIKVQFRERNGHISACSIRPCRSPAANGVGYSIRMIFFRKMLSRSSRRNRFVSRCRADLFGRRFYRLVRRALEPFFQERLEPGIVLRSELHQPFRCLPDGAFTTDWRLPRRL